MKLFYATIFLLNFFVVNLLAIDVLSYIKKDSTSASNDSIKTFVTTEIIVSDRIDIFDKYSSGFTKRLTLKEQLSSVSIGNLLVSKPGIFTKSYGSEGSLQTISIRGSGSEYTSVFINGISYNNSLIGIFDFSKFSSDEISEIIVKKGNDFEPFNNNSFGGVIILNPFEKNDTLKSSLKFQFGSFGYQGFQLKQSGSFVNTYYKIYFSHKSAKNNYEYIFNNESSIRKNADVNQNSLQAAFINQFSIFNEPVRFYSFFNFLDKKLGLPNFVSSNRHYDSETRERERDFSYSLNSKVFISNKSYISGIFGFQLNRLTIHDPLLSINLRTNYFDLYNNSFNTKIFLYFNHDDFLMTGGFSLINEIFQKSETKKNSISNIENLNRNTISSIFKSSQILNLNKDLKITSAFLISYNYISNKYQSGIRFYQFPNWRLGISVKSKSLYLISFFNAGSGIRIPNFYEYSLAQLTSLSNRELDPEKILNYEAGLRFEKENYLVEITYFTFNVKNKIIWKPQRVAFFSPINFGNTKSTGLELNIENIKLNKLISLSGNYTYTEAIKSTRLSPDDKSYLKQIPYVPKHKASVSIFFDLKFFEVDFISNFYSRRFFTEDNDILFSLNPVTISNLSITSNFKFYQFKFISQITIQNLFNQSYQLIQSFPMPGREYRLTIQMEV